MQIHQKWPVTLGQNDFQLPLAPTTHDIRWISHPSYKQHLMTSVRKLLEIEYGVRRTLEGRLKLTWKGEDQFPNVKDIWRTTISDIVGKLFSRSLNFFTHQ